MRGRSWGRGTCGNLAASDRDTGRHRRSARASDDGPGERPGHDQATRRDHDSGHDQATDDPSRRGHDCPEAGPAAPAAGHQGPRRTHYGGGLLLSADQWR